MTIVESLTWANNKLKEHVDVIPGGGRVDSPMLDAQLLLAKVLNVSKNYLFTHFSQELAEELLQKFEGLVERRRHHEPMAYILGWQEFYRRAFKINNFVLIPRPETETLIEEALKIASGTHDCLLIDVGTGSGAIAVTLSAETHLPALAIDISSQALVTAEQNAKIHQVEDRVNFLLGSLLEPIKPEMVAGLQQVILCANLPYLTTRQCGMAQSEVKDYEPRLALDGGVDGLDIYNNLFRQLADRRAEFPKKLTTLIEIDPDQKDSAPQLIAHYFPEAISQVIVDLSSKPRVVISQL